MKINELQIPQEELFNAEDVNAVINIEVNNLWHGNSKNEE